MYPHMTYPESIIVGLIQGVTELFPVSSLGHSVLIPALAGGDWASALNMTESKSPYLAFIVGLHVATALAMILYFWRDWLRIIRGFFMSVGHIISPQPGTKRFETQNTDQKLAWMIILATIPVGIVGVLIQHSVQNTFAKPVVTASILAVNGLILLGGERLRRRGVAAEVRQDSIDRQMVAVGNSGAPRGAGRHSSGQRAMKQQEADLAVQSDRRLVAVGWLNALVMGSMQVFALFPGISRDGIVMVTGMFRGLSRQDAARFSFLLSAPVIFAAGALKLNDLTGPLGDGIRKQVLAGSIVSGIGAYMALRFLMRYLSDPKRTLMPFAIYCLVAGIGSAVYLSVH